MGKNNHFLGCLFAVVYSFASYLQADICLVLVVKNDGPVIERMLDSVEDVVDCMCVCNAQSDNDIIPLLHAFAVDAGIPIKIVSPENENQDPWTYAVQAAQHMLRKSKADLSKSYLLCLESGMALTHTDPLIDMALQGDGHRSLSTKTSLGFIKKSLNFLKASLDWENQGAAFLDWKSPGAESIIDVDHLAFYEIEDVCFQNHFAQSIADALKEKEDPQSLLYLACAYKALEKYKRAIQLYQKHIGTDENREEIWLSHYMIGSCYEAMEEWEMAQHWYLLAYEYDPSRAESLQKLASHYRERADYHLAYSFAKQGKRVRARESQTLWPIPRLQPYGFDEELSIAAYYTPYREEGELAANALLLHKQVPWILKDRTYKNLLFYVKKIQEEKQLPIKFILPSIEGGRGEFYHPMNPSILKTENGYQVICRTVNYTQSGATSFHTNDPKGIFRTRNFLLNYDRAFRLQSQKEIIEELPRKKMHHFNLEGLDDCRIFQWEDKTWFSCNTGDTSPFETFQISLCQIKEDIQGPNIHVEKLIPLSGPDPHRCEKNWLPFVKEGSLHLIYSYDPLTIFIPDIQTGQCATVLKYQPALDFSHFRGSAAPIAFDEGLLLLVHEVVLKDDFTRCYLHRFLYLDTEFLVKKISKPFYFDHQGVEYCCSMTLDHAQKQLIIPIGIEDHEAHIYFFDCDKIRALLYPISQFSSPWVVSR